MGGESDTMKVCIVLLLFIKLVHGVTDANDFKILMDFKNGLDNPELLKWPDNGDDPCGPPLWPHVFCSSGRVTQIQVQGVGLKGTLPQNLNQLSSLSNIGLQRNNFYGKLPTLKGLSQLEYAFLDFNQFDTIPSDFFDGLTSIRVLALDYIPLNKTTGWSFPGELANSPSLTNLSMASCNLVGPLPDYIGNMSSLSKLTVSGNRLSGELPATFAQSLLSILWLNDQEGGGFSGSIDMIAKMTSLTQVWLHGNSFNGTIPENIGDLSLLRELNLNRNQLVGLVPRSLADLHLDKLDLSNNQLMGPIPEFKAGDVKYGSNAFCQSKPGVACAPQVNALLDFLGGVNYPSSLVSQWSGNDPCQWGGVNCDKMSQVSVISLPRRNLNGILSPSIANLDSLLLINLAGNSLSGTIPSNLTGLNSLRSLDVSGNNFSPPLPKFREGVKLVIDGNPLLDPTNNQSQQAPPPGSSPPIPVPQTPPNTPPSSGISPSPFINPPAPTSSHNSTSSPPARVQPQTESSKRTRLVTVGGIVGGSIVLVGAAALFLFCVCKKRKDTSQPPSSIVVHPRDPLEPSNVVKIAVSNHTTGSLSTQTGTTCTSTTSGLTENSHVIEDGNLVISVQVLRKVTNQFASANQLGSGGFGTVYKGEFDDGTKIAVKRMEAGVISNKALDEFHAEIAVLSKVRHRHLVSLLGYSIEGSERLLVYEYMSQGALSKHLFHWKSLNIEPLPWTRRLSIALDVARGIEYLHNLARQTFIHRDLKSSNILLGDDFRAKVSDFGLVKLAPDGEKSVVTRLAGTFGYLAPEYAVMGKITTKVDVFSYGVVLMELLTGLTALDEERSEETRYLVEWFWGIKSSKEKLMASIDEALNANEEIYESIYVMAELAGHCTAREPNHRPDMGHVVNVLSRLVEKWKPVDDEIEDCRGIDYSLPLPEMLKVWKDAESTGVSYTSTSDSKSSIPARPTGFAESFTSADGR
ncbi:hypothetical protein Tsubulata_028193 [Turnera subulata]|uniref:non-specific serine/threonine protein kinase n=1 Tax=Turnera subulata TaxID=218843 RepID=A0A9Q0FN68_9ROSI|nr:hypothetical protein Tsubulata_028193 [Turnera subulata]